MAGQPADRERPPGSAVFGRLLQQARRDAGLTQAALAERAGVSKRAIEHLEAGRGLPYAQTAARLADALGLIGAVRVSFEAAAHRPPARTAALVDLRPATHLQDLPLVGRAPELALLDQHLAGGGPPLLFLTGEPGIGKSRLLQQAATDAGQRGFTVLHGGCRRSSGQDPYSPVLDAIAAHLRLMTSAQRRSALAGATWLLRLLPELADVTDAQIAHPAEHERRLVFDSFRRCLERVGGASGTLLLLDDLQWAGTDALDLIAALARNARQFRLRVVAGYRSTDVSPADPLSILLADLAHAGLLYRHVVGPLESGAATSLLTILLAGEQHLSPEVQARILQRAGGVPFFLLSCAQAAHSSGLDDVPWDVSQSVQQRVASLDSQARSVLRIAAVIGRVAHHDVLVALAGQPESDVAAALDRACQAQLMVPEPGAQYRFVHDVIREAIEADIGAAFRTYLHRQIAQVLEAASQRPGPDLAAEVAWHFAEGNDLQPALRWSIAAGDHAEHVFAHADAERHYRRAAQLAAETAELRSGQQASEKLARALHFMGRNDEALTELEALARGYQNSGDLDGQLRVAAHMAAVLGDQNRHREAIHLLEPLVEEWSGNPVASAGSVAVHTLLSTSYRTLGQMDRALGLAQRAVDLANVVGDAEPLGMAESRLGWALSNVGRSDEAITAQTHAIALLERSGNLRWLATTYIDRAVTQENRGQYAAAWSDGGRAIDVARRLGDPLALAWTLGANAWPAWYLDGDWRKALALLDEMAPLESYLKESGEGGFVAGAMWIRLVSGGAPPDPAQLQLLVEQSQTTEGSPPLRNVALTCLIQLDVLTGHSDRALHRLAITPERSWDNWGTLPAIVEAFVSCGRAQEAQQRVSGRIRALRELERYPSSGLDRVRWIDALVAHGRLQAALGPWEDAQADYEEALAFIAAAAGRPAFSHGVVAEAYAELLIQQGNLDAARERLEEAIATFRRMNAGPHLARAEAMLNALTAEAPRK